MQINTLMTSSEIKRSRNLAKSENSNSLGKKSTRCSTIDVLAFIRHKINRNDPGKNIYWDLCLCCQFFVLKILENAVLKFKNPDLMAPKAVMPHLSL